LSSGSSIADAKGCKCSGLCESRRLSIVKERVYGKWGATLYQVSSHSQSIAEHFEQKCLSDDASLSCCVPRSNTALYILSAPQRHAHVHCSQPMPKAKEKSSSARDVSFSLGDLECVRVRSQVDRSACTAHLAADRAHTELIWHRCAGLDRESHSSTMAASLELDWHGFSPQKRGGA
jgi:hypothetical protein